LISSIRPVRVVLLPLACFHSCLRCRQIDCPMYCAGSADTVLATVTSVQLLVGSTLLSPVTVSASAPRSDSLQVTDETECAGPPVPHPWMGAAAPLCAPPRWTESSLNASATIMSVALPVSSIPANGGSVTVAITVQFDAAPHLSHNGALSHLPLWHLYGRAALFAVAESSNVLGVGASFSDVLPSGQFAARVNVSVVSMQVCALFLAP
jgi:hypothetical protein